MTTVKVDERVRIMTALLAATTWPQQEQDERPHGIHIHARTIEGKVEAFGAHPAVQAFQVMLDTGRSLDEIFQYVTCLSPQIEEGDDCPAWIPEGWDVHIREFLNESGVQQVWAESDVWEEVAQQAENAFEAGDPLPLLETFFGPQESTLVFHPNLAFPTIKTVGFRWDGDLWCICPPHVAWGTNPPWPYDKDVPDTHREAFRTYARTLLDEIEADALTAHDDLPLMLVSGMTAIYLERTFNEQESRSYVLMTRKEHDLDALPDVVDRLRAYVDEHSEGETIADHIEEIAGYIA